MARTFEVKLHVIEDDVTGATVVVPDDIEFEIQEFAIERDDERARELLSAGSEEDRRRGAALQGLAESMKAALGTGRKAVAGGRKIAAEMRFTLIKPGFGRWCEAESDATIIDKESGESRLDATRLMRSVLPESVQGMTAAQVADMEPEIAKALWARLQRSVRPDPDLLPFLVARRAGRD